MTDAYGHGTQVASVSAGAERYGATSSPGHEPSAITVGALNTRGSAVRSNDSVNLFSSSGPTRSSFVDTSGVRHVDNLLKPDLVAPGNKVLGAKSVDNRDLKTLCLLPSVHPRLARWPCCCKPTPGLTPPLIKASLQYSAQPVAGANLLQQGRGLLNVAGAVQLAWALCTDVSTVIEAGTLASGANLLANGKAFPKSSTSLNGQSFKWRRVVYVGASRSSAVKRCSASSSRSGTTAWFGPVASRSARR
jgi:serine protease AprX